MKRTAFAGLILMLFTILVLCPRTPVVAQGPTATAIPSASPEEILAEAKNASDAAERTMNTIGFILNFVQVAGILLGALIALLTASGFRTISQYRDELTQARAELEGMRTSLEKETDQVRIKLESETSEVRQRTDKAVRGLEYMQLGERLLAARNFKAAQSIYLEAHKLDPDNRATNYFLGEIYIQRKEIAKGIEHLERALAGGTDFAPAEAALAYGLRLQGDKAADVNERNRLYAQAESRVLKALALDPAARDINNESVWAVLGALYKRRNQVEDAIRSYEEARKVTPESSYPIGNLAALYVIAGKPDVAQPYYRQVAYIAARTLEGNPSDYWARFDLIASQLVLGQMEAALEQTAVVLSQVENAGPLETFADTLTRLSSAPHPPAGIEQVIQIVEQRIRELQV